jgi:hypothetical protein
MVVAAAVADFGIVVAVGPDVEVAAVVYHSRAVKVGHTWVVGEHVHASEGGDDRTLEAVDSHALVEEVDDLHADPSSVEGVLVRASKVEDDEASEAMGGSEDDARVTDAEED